MKKVMCMFFFATVAMAGFSMEESPSNRTEKQAFDPVELMRLISNPETGPTDCTIALKGQLSLPGASFDITCSVTRNSCEEATRAAKECVRAMMTAIKRDLTF